MKSFFSKKAGVIAGVTLVSAAFAFWAWHGMITGLARGIMASMSLKGLIVAVVLVVVSGFALAMTTSPVRASYGMSNQELDEIEETNARLRGKRRAAITAMVISVVLLLGAVSVLPVIGGFSRSVALAESVTVTDEPQPGYAWRTPWVVAALAAPSRAGNVIGDFQISDTTYLPGTGKYSTPVKARGFAAGLGNAVESNGSAAATSCAFTSEAPVSYGMFAANLNRAVSFIDAGLEFAPDDAWVFCDGTTAKMVVPVMRMAGQPEGHPVPAGIVVYDGANGVLVPDVKAGQYPGPVYPSSLAAAQRESLEARQGFLEKAMGRAGYETVEDTDADASRANVSELLLTNASGGFDFVTPLTPRGKSFTVTAVSVVPADRVTAGELNPLTVYRLAVAREGNLALADHVKATFRTELAGSAGIELVEVIPTSNDSWEGTLTNGRAVVNRVKVGADGTMCLLTPIGAEVTCADADGTSTAGATPGSPTAPAPSGELTALTDAQLAQLGVDVATEQQRRVTAPE